MFCCVCAAPAVWLLDTAAGGYDCVLGSCGEHVNRALLNASSDVIVTRVGTPEPEPSPTGTCPDCGKRQGWDGHSYSPCVLGAGIDRRG